MDISHLEDNFKSLVFIDGFNTSRDDCGNLFITITSGGVKKEGEGFPAYYSTQEVAEDAFFHQISLHTKRHKKVNIRKLPETKRMQVIIPSVWNPSGEVNLEAKIFYCTTGRFSFTD